jgi:hypothetical protein
LKGFEAIGKMVVVLLVYALAAIVDGLVLKVLWGWYVEPLGVTAITVAGAIGLALTVNLATFPLSIYMKLMQMEPESDGFEGSLLTIFMGIILAATTLGIGAVVHIFQ